MLITTNSNSRKQTIRQRSLTQNALSHNNHNTPRFILLLLLLLLLLLAMFLWLLLLLLAPSNAGATKTCSQDPNFDDATAFLLQL
jgi:hypothetical protein